MGYEIPEGYGLQVTTIQNTLGGASATSTIRMGFDLPSGSLAQGSADSLANITRDGLKPIWDSGWLVGPTRTYGNVGGNLVVFETVATEAGTAPAAVYSPPAVSMIVSKRTGLIGQAQRGRLYLPGVIESEVDETGTMSSTLVGDIQTAVDAWFTAFNTGTGGTGMNLLHTEGSFLSPTQIVALHVQPVVGNQRPRQRRS